MNNLSKEELENILKQVLLQSDGCCAHCIHSYHLKYVGRTCDLYDEKCKNHSMYEIDYTLQ